MNKFIKENWFKSAVMTLAVIAIFAFAYYLVQKNKVSLEKSNSNKNESLENKIEGKEAGTGAFLFNKIEEIEKLPFTSFWGEKPVEIKEAIEKPFELPTGYNIVISKDYKSKDNENFKVLALSRFVYKNNPDSFKNFDEYVADCSSSSPTLLAIVDNNNIIRYFSTLPTSCLFPENVPDLDLQSKKEKSLEFIDLNNDGEKEILVETYHPFYTDWLYRLNIFSFNAEKNEFNQIRTDRTFNAKFKEAYRVVSRKYNSFIVQAEAGVADCHTCPSVYTINIYEFNFYPNEESKGGYFFKVATIVSEKEFDTGEEVIDYKTNEIYKKIDNLDGLK